MKLLNLLFTQLVASLEYLPPLKIVLHSGYGTLSHAKPLLEIGSLLRARNHTVVYASFDGCEQFNKPYQFRFASLGSFGNAKDQRAKIKKSLGRRAEQNHLKHFIDNIGAMVMETYDAIYTALSKVIDEENPDIIACDFFSPACRDVAEMKGIPLITGFQSTDMLDIAPSSFITKGLAYGSITTDNLSFLGRFHDKIFRQLKQAYYGRAFMNTMNQIRSKHSVPPSLPFGDFSTSLGIANTFEGLEAATPLPPNIKMVGPIKSDSYTPLTSELTRFLDTHPRTLYVAFGTAVVLADFDIENLVVGSLSLLAEGSIDGIVWGLGKTIAEEFPESFTFNGTEITRDTLFTKHPHMRFLPWAPQTAILEHKNTRLFISHGGLESIVEASLSGTPILTIPFFGDQPRNARKLEDAGIGKYVNRLSATPATLASEIKFMFQDKSGSIAANVQRMRIVAQMGSRRKQLGADVFEEYAYAAKACRPTYPHRYGEVPCELKHLTMASREMSFIETNAIDVYAVASLIAVATLSVSLYTLWTALSYLGQRPAEDPNKKNL